MSAIDTSLADRLREAAEKATPGPWRTCPYDLDIYCESEKGGERKLFDVRGWGYLTGKGHGALGLSTEEGMARQRADAEFVALANPQTILSLLADRDAKDARIRELEDLIKDYEDVLADKRLLARAIDIAMHGEKGAAKQASLCDLVDPAYRLRRRAEIAEAALLSNDKSGVG